MCVVHIRNIQKQYSNQLFGFCALKTKSFMSRTTHSSGFSSSSNNDGNCGRTHEGKLQWRICTLQTQQQTPPSCGPVGTPLPLQCSPLGCSADSPKEKGNNVWLVLLTLMEATPTFCVEIVNSKQELKWNLWYWFVHKGTFLSNCNNTRLEMR